MISKFWRFIKRINSAVSVDYHYLARNEIVRMFYQSVSIDDNINSCSKTNLVVSLTTYGERINYVYITIKSILFQTFLPEKIILWLSADEFADKQLPLSLLNLQKKGLVIRYCEDIKSYKKLIPTLEEHSQSIIITVDDDMIYPTDMIENLYQEHLSHPTDVIFTLGKEITFNRKNEIAPYSLWKNDFRRGLSSHRLMGIGVGGILYPPNCFNETVVVKEKFMRLAPNADDLWFKSMAVLNGTKYRQTTFGLNAQINDNYSRNFISVIDKQQDKLANFNVLLSGNDIQLNNITQAFREVIKKVQE